MNPIPAYIPYRQTQRRNEVFYNEWDAPTAAWLTELSDQKHIPPGVVDVRSIRDVRPDDLRGYDQCHFFAGIGGWAHALEIAGYRDFPCWTGSPPCQPFSVAGKQAGSADERHLAPVWLKLIRECRPPIIFGEQVADAIRVGWLDDLFDALEGCGYACGASVLPACSVGAPHIRKRLFFGAVRLADVTGLGRVGRRTSEASFEPRAVERSDGFCDVGGLANTDGWDASAEREQPSRKHRQFAQDGRVVRLAHALGAGRGQTGRDPASDRKEDEGRTRNRNSDGSTNDIRFGMVRTHGTDTDHGGWTRADWLGCRDGKFRPVEPGTQPLAHGIPARVGRLRGYGNAIVPQVAAAFVAEFMDSVRESTCIEQQILARTGLEEHA